MTNTGSDTNWNQNSNDIFGQILAQNSMQSLHVEKVLFFLNKGHLQQKIPQKQSPVIQLGKELLMQKWFWLQDTKAHTTPVARGL
jgi:hypothetical protein